ncbi:MAG: class I SAM-dependent methyltransferase [Nanoarchaeota archaeon]|nr:class I SAM-dependent methyltransferase [Nanoarchaeota archaeon]
MKDKWEQQVKEWEDSLRYSDPEKIELKTILKEVNFNSKIILDVGCGIGRLTVPISRYAKKVVGIDSEKATIEYCNKYKIRKNIKYLHKNILEFDGRNFDIAILAQPIYENFDEILTSIHKTLKEKGKLIIIRWIDKGNQYNELLSPFWKKNKKLTKSVEIFAKDFTRFIKKNFNIKSIKLIKTYDSYPDKETLMQNIIRDSPIEFTNKYKIKLNNIVKKYNCRKIKITMKLYILENY